MKRSAFAMGAAMLLLGLMPGSTLAAGPSNLDQSTAVVTGSSLRLSVEVAQTFTAGKTGMLSAVDMWMTGSGSIAVSIKDTASALPTGPDLATASSIAALTGRWMHFRFPNPPVVVSGTQYAIVFNTGTLVAASWSPDNYPGGQALMNGSSGWVPIDILTPDWAFQTYVDTVTPQFVWDKASITAGATTPLTLTATMTYSHSTEAAGYMAVLKALPSWFTVTGMTCPTPYPFGCTVADFRAESGFGTSGSGDILSFILVGTANPALSDVGVSGVADGKACIYYQAWNPFSCVDGSGSVAVVAPAEATPAPTASAMPTPTPDATPTPTPTPSQSLQGATLPPTTAGAGPASDGTDGAIWLLPVGLFAFFGGAFALFIRRRRLA